ATATADAPASVAIGSELARKLDVRQGDAIILAVPDNQYSERRFAPRTGRFRVGRVFHTNFAEYDSEWIFIEREELRKLARMAGGANVIEVRLDSLRGTEGGGRGGGAAGGEGVR